MAQFDDDENYFSTGQHFSDLVLVVENTKFHVHKCILSMCSPVFEKMLTSDFSEKSANQIPLPSQRREEFAAFLRVIYSDVIFQEKQINDNNYESLIKLADEYQVREVKHLCCKFLISNVEDSNCLAICKVAENYNLEDVMDKCAKKASLKSYRDLANSEEFLGLNAESKLRLFAERIKYLEKNAYA